MVTYIAMTSMSVENIVNEMRTNAIFKICNDLILAGVKTETITTQ